MLKLKFQRVKGVEAPLPMRGTPSSAGIDFFVPFGLWKEGFYVLQPNEKLVIPLGLKVNIPKDYFLFLADKSGRVVNSNLVTYAPIVDEDYKGEIHAIVHNISNTHTSLIEEGTKIIQGILLPTPCVEIEEVAEHVDLHCDKVSLRGHGKFGSTGLTQKR